MERTDNDLISVRVFGCGVDVRLGGFIDLTKRIFGAGKKATHKTAQALADKTKDKK